MKDSYNLDALVKKSKGKRINSKNKGNTFQRKIAKMLNEKFGTTDFAPTPGSGAFATTHNLPKHLQIYGDLITPLKFKYVIECKKGYNKENLGSFFDPKSELQSFWKQCCRDADKAGKAPLVIFQQDRKNILVMVRSAIGARPLVQIYGDFACDITTLEEFLNLPREFLFEKGF